MENSKVKMVVPAGIGALSISGVEFDIVDGHTTVPHTMIEDALSHGLTVYVAPAVEETKTKAKPAKVEAEKAPEGDAPAVATGVHAVVDAVIEAVKPKAKASKAKAK